MHEASSSRKSFNAPAKANVDEVAACLNALMMFSLLLKDLCRRRTRSSPKGSDS